MNRPDICDLTWSRHLAQLYVFITRSMSNTDSLFYAVTYVEIFRCIVLQKSFNIPQKTSVMQKKNYQKTPRFLGCFFFKWHHIFFYILLIVSLYVVSKNSTKKVGGHCGSFPLHKPIVCVAIVMNSHPNPPKATVAESRPATIS
jgi:hypothetical protein